MEKKMSRFSMKCEFPVLTRKNKGKVLIVESFLWLSRTRQFIASFLSKNKFSTFSTLINHMIKCLLTELGRAGWEMFGSRSWHSYLCAALCPYVMTTSQILFHPCPLALSQLVQGILQRLEIDSIFQLINFLFFFIGFINVSLELTGRK